jgi:DNA sulfur modification protein DndD
MTQVRLLGWKATGLRCPDHELSLVRPDGRPYHVSLIQMPNGTGKTTTLELLRGALAGPAAWTDKDAIREYGPKANSGGRGAFELRLLVDERRFTIELGLDFDARRAEFRTTWGSSVPRFVRPPALVRVLTPEFVPFFVFDGELAQSLLDPKKTQARQALEVQFQLSTLGQFRSSLDRYWENKTRNTTARSDKGLTQRQNKLAELGERRDRLVAERTQLRKRIASLTAKREELNTEYKERFDQDTQAQQERQRLEQELQRVATNLSGLLASALTEARKPQNLSPRFTRGIQLLRENLDRLKLPESAAREFFDELAHDEHCVCGEEMTEARRGAILARRNSYLGKEDMGILNAIKGAVKDTAGDVPGTYRESFDKHLSRLREAVRERDMVQGELDALERRRLEGGDAELSQMKAKLDEFDQTLNKDQERLGVLEADDDGEQDDSTESLKALAKKIKRAGDLVAEATQTRDIRVKTTILKKIIQQAVERATGKIAAQLVQNTNARLETILTRSPLRVADVRDSVVLDGQSRGSPGQTLALGYAFLLGLFDAGQVGLPFVVDSPTGALDKNVRREIAELLPRMSQQLVAFTTSSEYEQFVPVLDRAAKGDVQYLTMFRLNPSTLPLLSRARPSEVKQFANGALIESKEFFQNFDSEAYEDVNGLAEAK